MPDFTHGTLEDDPLAWAKGFEELEAKWRRQLDAVERANAREG
jgi:hypothetical protein